MVIKKIYIIFFIVCSTSLTSIAYAAPLNPTEGPYTSDNNSSTVKSTFSWTETPYVFTQFDYAALGKPSGSKYVALTWVWTYGGETVLTESKSMDTLSGTLPAPDTNNHVNIWNAADGWDSLRSGRAGDWTVATSWSGLSGGYSTPVTSSFTLLADPTPAPEPVSAGLFIIGGVGLAWTKRKKFRPAA